MGFFLSTRKEPNSGAVWSSFFLPSSCEAVLLGFKEHHGMGVRESEGKSWRVHVSRSVRVGQRVGSPNSELTSTFVSKKHLTLCGWADKSTVVFGNRESLSMRGLYLFVYFMRPSGVVSLYFFSSEALFNCQPNCSLQQGSILDLL